MRLCRSRESGNPGVYRALPSSHLARAPHPAARRRQSLAAALRISVLVKIPAWFGRSGPRTGFDLFQSPPALGAPTREWRAPAPNGRRLDDRSIGLRERQQPVDDAFEVFDAREKGFGDEAVFAGHAVAFDDFGNIGDELGDPRQFAHRRTNADIGADREPDRRRIQPIVKPVTTPRSSSRLTRSEVLCGDRPISRARSASEARALRSSASIRRRSSSSSSTPSIFGDLAYSPPKDGKRIISAENTVANFISAGIHQACRKLALVASRPRRSRAAACVFPRQRGFSLSRTVFRGSAFRSRGGSRRRVAPHRFGRRDFRDLAASLARRIAGDRRIAG